MRTNILLMFALVILVMMLPVQAISQNGYEDSVKMFKNEMKNYRTQLETIESDMITISDCERLSGDYSKCTNRMDVFYNENMSFITLKSQVLYDYWVDIMALRNDIDKKMESLKQEARMEALAHDLEEELTLTAFQYDQLTTMFQQLSQMKRNAAKDTLIALKKRDMDIYPIYATQKAQNKDIIASNSRLDSLCKRIDSGHKTINEAQNIETVKWGDIIFKVTIVAALLAFLINLIVSKKKLNNQLNGKKNKKYTPTL